MDVIIMDMGEGVTGESTLSGYEGKLELLSYSHGVAMQITGDLYERDRTANKPIHQDIAVTRYLDAASPVLAQSCCQGKIFKQVDIVVGSNDRGRLAEAMRYTLKNVIISSVAVGGGGGGRPVETLTLNYTHITWKYTSANPAHGRGGAVVGSWNLETNNVG